MAQQVMSDIEIARQAKGLAIDAVAASLGLEEAELERYGRDKAKVSLQALQNRTNLPDGKLVLVSAIHPTPLGEGKTTSAIGLGDALNRIGRKASICLREPSLGPCFGIKGGAAGGGYSQVIPMESINLHFTGDFHAIGLAHNLLAAVLDNHLHQGNALGIDCRRVVWKRVLDMNDRALRNVMVGLGGPANSMPRESGFDITVASEVMAIFCLAMSLNELKQRLGDIIVAYTYDQKPVTARDLRAHGAMTVLLKDAFQPNLVQTLEHTPAFVHGGPFANIAHGCNSLVATRMALKLSDYVVTEAGFGADLGAEKFFNIICRMSGLKPQVVVLVATVRALKFHGGVAVDRLKKEDVEAVERGVENLRQHIDNVHRFHLPVVVAINRFAGDSDAEIDAIRYKCDYLGVPVVPCSNWADGGAGAETLAQAVVDKVEQHQGDFRLLYDDSLPLWQKIRTIAREIYGADDILADKKLRDKIRALERDGYGRLPVCMAKTQYSFSTDPALKGRPRGFDVPLRDVQLAAGAGFIVVLTDNVMTMPGLPRQPSAELIDLDDDGLVSGLF
ncbi:formate--tetrahydrofolate ligase [Motiliproteus sediminis]|uniref:formate--tetrahydrofolate ligase n=1 Tax=Motiliproteus sediminis TaxID=1468178 RepID=UPI001AEFDD45|nr:formate--tetrahydrofolate ligase [Motiliproteus sediminis]